MAAETVPLLRNLGQQGDKGPSAATDVGGTVQVQASLMEFTGKQKLTFKEVSTLQAAITPAPSRHLIE
jgi:hypothetical protein